MRRGEELGLPAFAGTIDGKFVVDIWGGYADEAQTQPWEHDTIVCVFSTTKVMTSICALILTNRGLLDPDAILSYSYVMNKMGGTPNPRIVPIIGALHAAL